MVEDRLVETGIEGAVLLPLAVIGTPGGAVLHMLRPGYPLQPAAAPDGSHVAVGELYFSEVLPGHVKAWKQHTRQVQHFAVPSGLLGLVLYDARPDSPTKGVLRALALGRAGTYALLRIPCGVCYGFTALGNAPAIICNAADIPHDPAEGRKIAPDSPEGRRIPFDWSAPFPAGPGDERRMAS